MITEEFYDGIPVVELPISDVDVPHPVHLRRSLRHSGEIDIEPVAAIEAALDPRGSSPDRSVACGDGVASRTQDAGGARGHG